MKKLMPIITLVPLLLIASGLFTLTYATLPKNTITVTGEAKINQTNKTATFNVGVSSIKDKKEDAVSEVNEKIKKIVDEVKAFGIDAKFIKTQNASIYRMEQQIYEEGMQKSKPGQWSVNNSIEVKLIDKDQAQLEAFANMLSSTEATSVNGPYFETLENSDEVKLQLYKDAIKNAEEKAAQMAKDSGRKLGKVVSIIEGTTNSDNPILFNNKKEGMGGGGTTIEPGTNSVKGTVTVVYELRHPLFGSQ